MDSNNNNVPFATRRQIVILVALGCLNIVLIGIAAYLLPDVPTVVFALSAAAVYMIEVAILGVFRQKNQEYLPEQGIHALLGENSSTLLKSSNQPIAIFNMDGMLLWCNPAMFENLYTEETPVGKSIDYLFGDDITLDGVGGRHIRLSNRIYATESFVLGEGDEKMLVLLLSDITSLTELEQKHSDSRVCVAYIAIDNIEDVLQYVHEKFRVAVSIVDDKLKNWADSMNAVLKSYDNDKYIMFFDSVSLDKCIAERFPILEEIRSTRVGDGVSITVSIGVARSDGSLRERELMARDAIDLALQRGGDQVVYTENGVTEHFGGRTKTGYKRSNVRSRTFTNQLTALIGRADNVIIMGHRFGDFDSFGASIGIARIADICGVKVNIAVDLRDKNLIPLIRILQETEQYSQTFVDNVDALDLIGPDTLLVLVDHHDPARAQFGEIAKKMNKIVIIDHHRKTDAVSENVLAYYIDPSASSTCELVAEMLESAVSSQNLTKEEADMLLSGIILDTKQFTRNTGTRTFSAAQYLRGAGASPTDVYAMFKTEPDELKKEARFHTDIKIYRGNIAISGCEGENDNSYRIIASKAADKMLSLKGIEAAFTVVRIGDSVHISGRSNGVINVQLILEKLNGGGHFDVAGAQVSCSSVREVMQKLKSAIDDYLDD